MENKNEISTENHWVKNYQFSELPKELYKRYFEPSPMNFMVDMFEELVLRDVYLFDEQTKIKLNTDVSNMLGEWLEYKVKAKENVNLSIGGRTRCQIRGTPILMENLTRKNIEDCKIGDKVISYNTNNNSIEIKEIINTFENGIKQNYELKLYSNKKNYCTHNHPFFVWNKHLKKGEWKQLKDITTNDYVATINELPIIKNSQYSKDIFEFIGFYLGDGYTIDNKEKGKILQFDLSLPNKIDYLFKLVKNIDENLKIRINKNRNNKGNINLNKKSICYGSKDNYNSFKFSIVKRYTFAKKLPSLLQTIINLRLFNVKSKDKFIPNELLLDNDDKLYSLLSGLINSDGNISYYKKNSIRLSYSTISKNLIEDIKILLTKLNIQFSYNKRIIIKNNIQYNDLHTIRITNINSLKNIHDNCNLTKNKKELLENWLSIKNISKQENNYKIINNNLIYYKVKSIKEYNRQKTYDIEIKDNHNFISDTILIHNSGKSISATAILIKYLEIQNLYIQKQNETNISEAQRLGIENPAIIPLHEFDLPFLISPNQFVWKQRLKNAQWGSMRIQDENDESEGIGEGSESDTAEIRNIMNITAVQNIGKITITPERIIHNNSQFYLKSWGKDTTNWYNRFLFYKMNAMSTTLIGYVIIDLKRVFTKFSCYIFKDIGSGCTNNARKLAHQVNKDLLTFSSCIPSDIRDKVLAIKNLNQLDEKTLSLLDNTTQRCPFFNVCNHPYNAYEKQKLTSVMGVLEGGKLDERTKMRFITAIKLLPKMSRYDTINNRFTFKVRNKEQLKIKLKFYISEVSSGKFTIGETNEILATIGMINDMDFLKDVCVKCEINFQEYFDMIEKYEGQSNEKEQNLDEEEEKPKKKFKKEPEKEIISNQEPKKATIESSDKNLLNLIQPQKINEEQKEILEKIWDKNE